jgi:hypothetical protein
MLRNSIARTHRSAVREEEECLNRIRIVGRLYDTTVLYFVDCAESERLYSTILVDRTSGN